MDLLAAGLLLVCLVGILLGITGIARRGVAARSAAGLGSYVAPSRSGGLVAGLIVTLAVAGPAAHVFGGPVATVGLGAAVGVLFAVLGALGAVAARNIIVAVAGVIGVVGAALLLLATSTGCSPVPLVVRVLAIVVIAVAAGGSIAASVLAGRFRVQSIGSVFGVVRVVTFLASPFGVSIVELVWPAWVVVLVAALAFGALAGVAPDFVIGLTAFGLSMASVIVTTTLGSPCSVGAPGYEAGALLGYLVVYGLARLAATLRRSPR